MRYIILLFALSLSIAKASAQDVLNEVLRTSDAALNDTTKSMDERRTALFKFEHKGSLSQRAGLRHERIYYALPEAIEGGF